jgi:hypothetical protein
MPNTKESIEKIYQDQHQALTEVYYSYTKPHTQAEKDAFDIAHAKIWRELETALTIAGYYTPPGPEPIDWLKERIDSLEAHQWATADIIEDLKRRLDQLEAKP